MVIRALLPYKYVLLLVACFFFWGESNAQVRFEASAPRAVPLNERFQITFTIENGYGTDFVAPSFEGLNVLYPPANAISRMDVNGKKSMTYTGTFMGQKRGKVKVQSATVKVKGKSYHTKPFTIEFLPESKSSSSSSSSSSSQKHANIDIFIRAIPSKTLVYEQEALLVTFKLYTSTMNIGFEEVKFPEFDGFIEENIPMSQSIMLEMEHYKGKNYYTATLKKCLIFPQRTGKLTVPPGEFRMLISEESSALTEDSFLGFSSPIQYSKTISSPELTIEAKPLPQPHPSSFGNAVGNFELKWEGLPHGELKSNDVVSLRLAVKGHGNLKLLTPPEVRFPESFEVYDPKSTTDLQSSSQGVSGKKTFEYNVIPRNKGTFTIAPIEFSYFDPSLKRYITTKTKPLTMKVAQGESERGGKKSDVELLGNDIAYLMPYTDSSQAVLVRYLSTWYVVVPYILILLIGGCVATLYVRYRRRLSDVVGTRKRQAPKRVRKDFSEMESWVVAQQGDRVYERLPQVIYAYLVDKFNLRLHAVSQKGIQEQLLQKGVSDAVVTALLSILQKAEAVAFSDKVHKTSPKELLEEANEVINQLENERLQK